MKGLLFAATMILLSGCGDAKDPGVDAERPDEVSGLPCDVPSPTGDAVNRGTGKTARQEVADELRDGSFLASATVAGEPACPTDMTAAQCRDAAHDFRGPTGTTPRCLVLAATLSGGACRPGSGASDCVVLSFGTLDEQAVRPRATVVCSRDGRFLGWWCNN
jgi:hypothetical protein